MSNTDIMKNKYLKYKTKYINLKKLSGGVITQEEQLCAVCPTRDIVIKQLEEIVKQVPSNCIKYTFIPDELNSRFLEYFKSNPYSSLDDNLTKEYENFLKITFFDNKDTPMNTQPRLITTSYRDFLQNSSSITWHQDTEVQNKTFYNILYYLTLDNCRPDCGTDIAFRNSPESEIITIRLPVIQGLILALKDDCFAHKSPVVSLIDPEKLGTRLIIRTYAKFEESDQIMNRNASVQDLIYDLNLKKLKDCLKEYFSETIDKSKKTDCYNFFKYYWRIVKNYPDDDYYKEFSKYFSEHDDFFKQL